MLSGLFLSRFGVLFCSLVPSGRYITLTTGPCCQRCQFLTGGAFGSYIAHRRSVAVLRMLSKIRCNPMNPLYGALPEPYVTLRATRSAMIGHRYTYASPRCKTSHYHRTFIHLWVSQWNNLCDPVFDGVGLADFKSWANAFLLAKLLTLLLSSTNFLFSSFILWVGIHWKNK